MKRLMVGLVLIVLGIAELPKAQEIPSIEQVVGVVAEAWEADCAMLLNLTDDTGVCYYVFANKSSVESTLKRYAKYYELEFSTQKVYDALAIVLNDQLIMVRKSEFHDAYVVLVCQ